MASRNGLTRHLRAQTRHDRRTFPADQGTFQPDDSRTFQSDVDTGVSADTWTVCLPSLDQKGVARHSSDLNLMAVVSQISHAQSAFAACLDKY